MVNIPLIRATQKSILDEGRPFDMGDWDTCIAGHASRCAQQVHHESWLDGGVRIANIMGLDFNTQARPLFGTHFSRQEAVAILGLIISSDEVGIKLNFLYAPWLLCHQPPACDEPVATEPAVTEPELVLA